MSTTERHRLNRHRLEKFSIAEVSAVDDPAQIHASALVQKRRSDRPLSEGEPFLKGSGNIVAVSRQLSKEEKTILQSAQTARLIHDEDTLKVLDAKTVPLTAREQTYLETLSGEPRRQFLLADHDGRDLLMAEATTIGDEHMKYATSPADAAAYSTFDDAVARLAKEQGITKYDAMPLARKQYPDLFNKSRDGGPSDGRTSAIQKAHDDGHAKQAKIDAAVSKLMKVESLDRTEALRKTYATQPELFAD